MTIPQAILVRMGIEAVSLFSNWAKGKTAKEQDNVLKCCDEAGMKNRCGRINAAEVENAIALAGNKPKAKKTARKRAKK